MRVDRFCTFASLAAAAARQYDIGRFYYPQLDLDGCLERICSIAILYSYTIRLKIWLGRLVLWRCLCKSRLNTALLQLTLDEMVSDGSPQVFYLAVAICQQIALYAFPAQQCVSI